MHISLLKPFLCCGAGLHDKKKNTTTKKPETLEEEVAASEFGSLVSQDLVLNQPSNNAQTEFLNATAALASNLIFESHDSIPCLENAYYKFLTLFPKYESSHKIDQLRSNQYPHISNVCLDYTGFGLFSFLQTVAIPTTSTFALSEFPPINIMDYLNLPDENNNDKIKSQIMDFLNIPKNEYDLVFTVDRGSAFELLAESYPFQTNMRLLTMFDHESQSMNRMAKIARDKGATVESDWFEWPTLDLCSTLLREQISRPDDDDESRVSRVTGRKNDSSAARGLFVFPAQSRVTGAKYSYQWLGLARRNNWHVLFDAGALGPKEMDALALSFYRPDFIIASFYRIFGHDPTGFGCLLIKKSTLPSLQGVSSDHIVTIKPFLRDDETDDETDFPELEDTEAKLAVFSGCWNKSNEVGRCGAPEIFEESMIEIKCQHLEHLNMLSLDKIASRLRFLINWLVTSMMQLRLPGTNGAMQLVDIYGPKVCYERGGAIAFNVRRDGERGMISPEVVQKMAVLDGISLSVGKLSHIRERCESWSFDGDNTTMEMVNGCKSGFVGVVTASLGFLSDFEDVYKLWAFVAKFLDPGFYEEDVVEHVG